MESIGNRMKCNYENRYRIYLTRRTPVIVRLDGKAFHTLTRHCEKPFDQRFMDTMLNSATKVAKETQGFKLAYVQSDEVNFLITDYDTLDTEAYFDYNLQKIISIMAGQMSAYFTSQYGQIGVFDGRAFNVPESEIANVFLWRALDWQRNSIQMYCQSLFSHKQLHGKDQKDMHEMLHDIGKNWTTDLTDWQKNGVYILPDGIWKFNVTPSYKIIEELLNASIPKPV